jgi:hypothetical protein
LRLVSDADIDVRATVVVRWRGRRVAILAALLAAALGSLALALRSTLAAADRHDRICGRRARGYRLDAIHASASTV